MRILQKSYKILLLIVLLGCLGLKGTDAYTTFRSAPQVKEVVRLKLPANQEQRGVVSSNVVMAWNNEDGTIKSFTLDKEEFYNLQVLALNMPSNEFNEIITDGRRSSKEYFMSTVNQQVAMLRGENEILHASIR